MHQDLIKYDKYGNFKEVQEVQQIIAISQRHFKKGDFFMETFNLNKLILEKNYSSTTIKVLICLKTRLDFNNRIKTFRQIDLAEEAKTSQANVSRALKQLLQDKVIRKTELDYYFNENLIKYASDDKSKKYKELNDL